jgi:phage shock protein PspC (stress-responsive transcriptional regulator)
MQTRLIRSETDKMIGGVCGGIAAYLNVDSVLVRFAFIMLIFASGIGLPLYVILLILMPAEKSIDVQTDYADLDFQKEIKITEEDIDKAQEFNAVDGRSNPQGPIIFAGILILIGVYLLAQNFGFLSFLNIGWFGPLLIIGFGLYVIYRRK